MDANLVLTVFQVLKRECVIEILRISRVNSESGRASKIASLFYLFSRDAGRNLACSVFNRFRKLQWEAEVRQDGVHLGVVFSFLSEYMFDRSYRVFSILWPVGYAD